MEGNDWYNRTGYTDYRNHFRGDDRPLDQSVFRGDYRFNTESPHHNETAYNRNVNRNERREEPRNYDRTSGYSGSGRTENYNQGRDRSENRNMPRDSYRYDDRNRGNYSRGYWMDEETQQPESMYRSTHISGNFEDYYKPDPYYAKRGENYGNMAGSLSVGYDGDRNAEWDEHRYYNPLTGHRRSYHGNYTSRHPEQGNEQQDRNFDRDNRNDYDRY